MNKSNKFNSYVFCHSSLPAVVVIDAESEDDAFRTLSLLVGDTSHNDEDWVLALGAEIDENDKMLSVDLKDRYFHFEK